MKNKDFKEIVRILVQGAGVAIFIFWAAKYFPPSFKFEQEYAGLIRAGVIALALAISICAFIYIPSKRRSKLLMIMSWAVTGLAWITISPWLIGGLQDALNMQCTGFWGVQQSCVNNWKVGVSIALFHPFVFIPLIITIPIFLALGSWQALRAKH